MESYTTKLRYRNREAQDGQAGFLFWGGCLWQWDMDLAYCLSCVKGFVLPERTQ